MYRFGVTGALVLLVALASGTGGGALPNSHAGVRLIDCRCYDLFSARPDGATRRLLSTGGSRDLFDVSADRTQLLYSHRSGSLSASTIAGTRTHELTTQDGMVDGAAFSPDGGKIAYLARSPNACGHEAVHVMNADGSDDRTLLADCGGLSVSWSPDSTRLAYVRYSSASATSGQLLAANADASDVRVLTRPERNLGQPAWSPTGDRIAFVAGRIAMIHLIGPDGSNEIAISRGRTPSWAPDGRKLEYLWQPGYGRGAAAAIIARDGTHNHVLDPRAIDPYSQGVGWSPDGKTILYRVELPSRCGCRQALYSAEPDGSDRRSLLSGVANEEFGPLYWTRDGSRIIYTRYIQHGE